VFAIRDLIKYRGLGHYTFACHSSSALSTSIRNFFLSSCSLHVNYLIIQTDAVFTFWSLHLEIVFLPVEFMKLIYFGRTCRYSIVLSIWPSLIIAPHLCYLPGSKTFTSNRLT